MQSDGTIQYQGAIDDWYVSLGEHRPEATRQYLQDAMNALVTGEKVSVPKTAAVGCLVE